MNEHFDDLKFHRLLSSEDALFGPFSELFQSSFPVNERRPLESLKKIISDESDVYCDAVLRNNVYVGLLVYWDFADFVYVEYLAVDPDIRGGGIGARILSQLRDGARKPVVLEVEPPLNELAKRRIGFYERNGFVLLDNEYFQPSYGLVPGLELKLMSSGNLALDISEVIDIIHRRVYGVKK